MKRTLLLICTAVFFMALFGGTVRAAEWEDTISLPVLQSIIPDKDCTVNYTLTAENAACPMPEGSDNGIYRFSLKGSQSYMIPSVTVTEQGRWHYTLSAESKELRLANDSLEITVYGVYDGTQLTAGAFARLPNGKKTDLHFTGMVLDGDREVSVESVPESSNTEFSRPESVSSVSQSEGSIPDGSTVDTGNTDYLILYFVVSVVSAAVIVFLSMKKQPKSSKKYQ